jgi:hypothetical protein
MDSDPGSPAMGPSGRLPQRVGDHIASVDRLIEQSRQAIGLVKAEIEQTDRRVARSFPRIRDAVGAGHAANRARTGSGKRYLRAKERELAAHERAIQRHDEAAALQERFGHSDRAAAAREHGRQARELHQQALWELHAWAGSAPAAEE